MWPFTCREPVSPGGALTGKAELVLEYNKILSQSRKNENPAFRENVFSGRKAPAYGNLDGIVKSPKSAFFVIPANPGPARRTRLWQAGRGPEQEPESGVLMDLQNTWTPSFNGVTTFYEFINNECVYITWRSHGRLRENRYFGK
jgi:hypothetical protein